MDNKTISRKALQHAFDIEAILGIETRNRFLDPSDRGAMEWKPKTKMEQVESLLWEARNKLFSVSSIILTIDYPKNSES